MRDKCHNNTSVNISELVQLGLEYAEKFGNVVRVWLGSNLIVFLTDPNDVEVILNSQVHIDKAREYRFFKPWLGEGLLISTGIPIIFIPQWKGQLCYIENNIYTEISMTKLYLNT